MLKDDSEEQPKEVRSFAYCEGFVEDVCSSGSTELFSGGSFLVQHQKS